MFNERNSIIALLLIWLIAILISMPFLWMVDFIENPYQCQLNMSLLHLIYVIGMNVAFIFIPTIALSILYAFIIKKIKSVYMFRKSISDCQMRKSSKLSLDSRRKSENVKLFQDKPENIDQAEQAEIKITDSNQNANKLEANHNLNIDECNEITKLKTNFLIEPLRPDLITLIKKNEFSSF